MLSGYLKRLIADESGIAAIEYGLIASLIAVALSATFMSIGNDVEGHYDSVGTDYAAANASTAGV